MKTRKRGILSKLILDLSLMPQQKRQNDFAGGLSSLQWNNEMYRKPPKWKSYHKFVNDFHSIEMIKKEVKRLFGGQSMVEGMSGE